ncbi:NitT/TauT family transport system permease protein/taurine transport system permease protein [Haloactinopolyspora alba]|uniref:NitT/TauT family transport system permease protein/taurine transport system permease protein n=1 Tax=Haloactinopolyspora alba TaxID=648780 RepID=A0A2P8DRE7_9ACTN|nr:ABC transporter permease [Haloactinopolyspora alba]PSK99787.1 NitT/TauT family transport system permease protein/taurine transport system permease protein [Haloactinopolyspora alba]
MTTETSTSTGRVPLQRPYRPPRKRGTTSIWRRGLSGRATFVIGVASSATLVAVWHLLSATALVSPLLLPPPLRVAETFWQFLTAEYLGETLVGHTAASMTIVAGGWLLGGLVGLPLGILIGWSDRVRWLVFPLFQLLRPVPPLAWIPLAIVWLGIGDPARIFVVFLSAVVPWTINSMAAVSSVDPLLIRAARTLGAGDGSILRRVVIHTATPTLVAGARIALGNAWTTLIAAELLAASAGLGFVALNASQTLSSDILLVSMGIIGVLGALFSAILRGVGRAVAPWAKEA